MSSESLLLKTSPVIVEDSFIETEKEKEEVKEIDTSVLFNTENIEPITDKSTIQEVDTPFLDKQKENEAKIVEDNSSAIFGDGKQAEGYEVSTLEKLEYGWDKNQWVSGNIIKTGANLVEKTDEPEDDDDDDFDPATSRQIRRGSLKHTRSTVHRVHSLHDEFHSHELALQIEQEKRQKKERRKTLHRVEVRAKLIRSKVMRKVRIFQQLDDTGLANLIEHMTIRNFKENEKIIEQGSVATCFYIITTGVVSVTQKTINDMVKGHEVARLNENSFFGENCFKMGSKDERVCNATVTAVGMVRTLAMENSVLEKLVEDGIIDRKDLEKGIAEEQERRERMTKVKLLMERSKFAKKSNGGGERSLFS